MSGTDAIIAKIKADAQRIANSTCEEGAKRGSEIRKEAENDSRIYIERNLEESRAEREEIIRRKITAGNLEVRKMILQTKQTLIGTAFERAAAEIKKDKKGYAGLLERMLKLAEDGDTVVFAEADKKLFDGKWLKSRADAAKIKLIFGGYGDFSGGMIISNGGSDKNMTLDVELKELREKYEPEIAKLMFGDGV